MFHKDSSIIMVRFLPILLLLVLNAVLASDCPANYDIDGLVAGSRLLLTQQGRSQLSFTYTFDRALASSPGVAVAVQDIALGDTRAQGFSVFPQNSSVRDVMFVFSYSSSWNKIRINFWASASQHI